jgi:hypothetical protein
MLGLAQVLQKQPESPRSFYEGYTIKQKAEKANKAQVFADGSELAQASPG